MNLEDIKSLQFSLLHKKSEIDNSTGKSTYEKKVTAKFIFPENFPKEEDYIATLCEQIYEDLLNNAPEDIDSIGIWVECGNITYENSISLRTLRDISMYSKDNVYPIFEFLKMTIQNYETDI